MRCLAMAFVVSSFALITTSAHAQCIADINGTGVVDGSDLSELMGMWGQVGDVASDINNDGIVDSSDLSLLLAGWGPCAGPEWATVIEWAPDPAIVYMEPISLAITATGLPWRVRDNASNIEMLLVPPGTFTMGCTASIQYGCFGQENPTHQVTLTDAFYLGRYEVTQEQWQAEMGSNPSYFVPANGFSSDQTKPVDQVSWNSVQPFLTQNGLRLPTEAEWEFAYRAGTTEAFHNGSSDDNTLPPIAWYSSNAGGQTHPVGGKQANALGMHDMSGNVWEWVNDWYGSNYYLESTSSDPAGPAAGAARVLRGGAWFAISNGCRASFRHQASPTNGYIDMGFRVARTP